MSTNVSDMINRVDAVFQSDQTSATTESLLRDISFSQISSDNDENRDFTTNSMISDSELKNTANVEEEISGIKSSSSYQQNNDLGNSNSNNEGSSFVISPSDEMEIKSFISLFNSKFNCTANNLGDVITDIDSLLRQKNQIQANISSRSSPNSKSTFSVQNLIEKISSLENENQELQDKLDSITSKYNEVRTELDNIRSQSLNASKENSSLQQDLSNLQIALAQTQDIMEGQLSDLSNLGNQRTQLVEIVNKQTRLIQYLESMKTTEISDYRQKQLNEQKRKQQEPVEQPYKTDYEKEDEIYTILSSISMIANESLPYDISQVLLSVKEDSSYSSRERVLLMFKKLSEIVNTVKGTANKEIQKTKELSQSNDFYKKKCMEIISDYKELLHFVQTFARSSELQNIVSGKTVSNESKNELIRKYCQLSKFVEDSIGQITEEKLKEAFSSQLSTDFIDRTHIFDLLTSHQVEDQVENIIARVSSDNIDAIEMTNLLAAQIFINDILKRHVSDLHTRIALTQRELALSRRPQVNPTDEKLNKQLMKQQAKMRDFLLKIVSDDPNLTVYQLLKKAIKTIIQMKSDSDSSLVRSGYESSVSSERSSVATSSEYQSSQDKEIKRLNKKLKFMEKQYAKLADTVKEENISQSEVAEKNKELTTKIAFLEAQAKEYKDQITSLQNESKDYSDELESAKAMAQTSMKQNNDLQKQYDDLKEQSERKIEDYREKLSDSQEKISVMTRRIEENSEILSKIKKQRYILGKQIERLQTANQMLQDSLECQSDRMKRESDDSIAALQIQLSTAKREIAKQSKLYEEINNKCKQLQSENATQVAARKTAEFKLKAAEERMMLEKKGYESKVTATNSAAQAARESIENQTKKQIADALYKLSSLLTTQSQPKDLNEAVALIESDLTNLRNSQAVYVSTLDSVLRAQKLLNVRSPSDIAPAVENLLEKMSNADISHKGKLLSNSELKQENEKLKRQIRINDTITAQLKQWENWARRLNNVIHQTDSLRYQNSSDIRLSLEESVLSSMAHRDIVNRVESLRMQKQILTCYDRRILSSVGDRVTLRNLIIVGVSIRRIQKLAGCIPFTHYSTE